MHPALALSMARVGDEFARWRAVADDRRADMPAWWWAPALAARNDTTPMPKDVARAFGLGDGAHYGEAAQAILAAMGEQTHQPWPEHFPETAGVTVEDPAPSAEPAAQAASAAIMPIA